MTMKFWTNLELKFKLKDISEELDERGVNDRRARRTENLLLLIPMALIAVGTVGFFV